MFVGGVGMGHGLGWGGLASAGVWWAACVWQQRAAAALARIVCVGAWGVWRQRGRGVVVVVVVGRLDALALPSVPAVCHVWRAGLPAWPCTPSYVSTPAHPTQQQVQLSEEEIKMLCSKSRDIFLSQPILIEMEVSACARRQVADVCTPVHIHTYNLQPPHRKPNPP